MSALRRIKKVEGGYEVTVKCTNKPMEERVYRTYAQCEKFADDYFLDYLGVALNSIHHPEGEGVEPEGLNPDSLETIEIEIPMSKRLKELAEQAGLEELGDGDWCSLNHPDVRVEHLERFAELVRQDEANGMRETYMKMIHGAIAEEREACAKLCEEQWSLATAHHAAELIRARGNHEQD
jgi:hypothetical protein